MGTKKVMETEKVWVRYNGPEVTVSWAEGTSPSLTRTEALRLGKDLISWATGKGEETDE